VRIGIACLEFTKQAGIGRSVVELTRGLARFGHEVHCHCIECGSAFQSQVHLHKIRTVDLVNTTRLISFAVAGRAALEKQGYDITHSMGNMVGCDILTAHSCHKAGLIAMGRSIGPADRVRLLVERRNYLRRRYRRVIAVARGVKEELMHHYGVPAGDISVIPNGVDLEEFHIPKGESRRLLRTKLGLSNDDPVAIFVSNEFDRKGLEFVIRALPYVRSLDLKVVVAGRDNPSRYLALASDLSVANRIRFMGCIDDIAPYYAASDVFVFPSSYEAFSLATLEAAASGLPLLTTRINGSEELVEDGVNGFFIERDAHSIASRLSDLIDNRELRHRLSYNARASAESYGWENVTRKTIEVYHEAAAMKAFANVNSSQAG
jgi:UDP-glucose:(heptosyl)LPS alpha-1,3-glucosyltransferase